jgi:hypothetical protein
VRTVPRNVICWWPAGHELDTGWIGAGGLRVVAIDRPSMARLVLVDRAAGDLPALLLVLTPIALLNVLVGIRSAGAPGPSEMDAVVAASLGPSGAAGGDVGFLGQLSVVQAVAGATAGTSLLQSARGLCLLAGLASAALLWPVLRRLGLTGNAAATAVIVAGLGPLALRLQPTVDPGAVAAFWIVLAAALRSRVRSGGAGTRRVWVGIVVALALAALTTPVAAAGLLAAAAHALATAPPAAHGPLVATLAAWWRPALRAGLAVLAAVAAGAALTAAVLPAATGSRGAVVPLLTLLALLGVAAVVLTRVRGRRPRLRAAVTMTLVWLACALLPGQVRLTALLLAVPALALLAGTLLADTPTDRRPRVSIAAATAVTVALVSGMVTVLWPVAPPPSGSYGPLARWLNRELEEGVVLSAAPLDRAELIAAGVPAHRFAAASVPDGAVTVVPTEAGCGQVGTPVVQLAAAAGPLSVCAPAAVPDGEPGAAGRLLADNPAVGMPDPARSLLQRNRVDDRLVAVLAGAATAQPLEVTDFPAVPGEPVTAVRRTAVLDGVVPAVDVNGRPAASALELHLNAQRPPLRPDLRALPDGRLVVHFRLPTGDR